jgi:hypothetical protein
VPMADLSHSAAPSPSGKFCYGWMWNRAPEQDAGTSNRITLVNTVNTASGGPLYPVSATPAAGTLVAYSLRAFVMLHDRHTNQNKQSGSVGASIGLVAKFPGPNTDYDQEWNKSPTGSLSCSYLNGFSDHDPISFNANGAYGPRIAGYSLQLSNLRFDGEQTPGDSSFIGSPAGNVRLVFRAPRYKDIDHINTDGYFKTHVCGGTYAYNTWYHIRMDVIPNSGFDTIKVYTAAINASLGSETWTLRDTISITDTSEYYVDWSSSGHEYKSDNVGFFTQYSRDQTGSARTQYPPSCLVDKFEFFTKNIA